MIVELEGLQVFAYHGVEEDEARLGQIFLFDVQLDVGDRGADDEVEHAVDYRAVVELIRDVNDTRYNLLEALATATADALQEQFSPSSLRVRVRKPEVKPAGATLVHAAVIVQRP